MSQKKKVESLDPAQLAALGLHANVWSARTRDTTPLDARSRRAIEAAFALWYRASGLRWHNVVVWVDSPVAGRIAAVGCADKLCALRRAGRLRLSRSHVYWLVCLHWLQRQYARSRALGRALGAGLRIIPRRAMQGAIGGLVPGFIWGMFLGDYCMRVWFFLCKSPVGMTLSMITGFVLGLVVTSVFAQAQEGVVLLGVAAALAIGAKLGLKIGAWGLGVADPGSGVHHVLGWLRTMGIIGLLVALITAVIGAVRTARGEYRSQREAARIVDGAAEKLRACLEHAAQGVAAQLSSRVVEQIRSELRPRIADVRATLRTAVDAASGTLTSALSMAALASAESATRVVLSRHLVGPVPLSIGNLEQENLSRHDVTCIDGQLQGLELAELAFHRTLVEPSSPAQEALLQAIELANSAGPFWAHSDFVLVCAQPEALFAQGTTLHRADGPALQWPGFRLYFSHGSQIEAALLEQLWTGSAIRALRDDGQRRAVIEYLGWQRYLALEGVPPLATVEDPGNPDQTLALYDPPAPYRGAFRLLTMVNGSAEPNGELRVFGEPVPASFSDPIEAAAWAYDCPADVYRQLGRRT